MVTFHIHSLIFERRVGGMKLTTRQERMGASMNDYGAKASRDLIVTRGAGFRKEKNKKKRGVRLLLN